MDNDFSEFEQYAPDAAPSDSGSDFSEFEQYAPSSPSITPETDKATAVLSPSPAQGSNEFSEFEQYAPPGDYGSKSPTPETDKAAIELPTQHSREATRQPVDWVALERDHPYVYGVLKALSGVIPKSLEDLKQMATLPKPSADVEKEQKATEQLGQAWRGELGPAAQAEAITGTALQALPLAGLPFSETPLKPTLSDLDLVGRIDAARTSEAQQKTPQTIEAQIGGEQNAIEPSNAQMEVGTTPLGIETGTGGAETQPSGSDYAIGETGGEEPVLAGTTPSAAEPVISPEPPAAEQPTEVSLPIPEAAAPVPTTYFKGDKAEYTGNVHQLHGGTFYEVKILEGTDAGKLKVVVNPPPASVGAPRLLPGETQGDMISSTQQEPMRLVGEEGTDFSEQMTAEQERELERMRMEEEQAQLQDLQDYQQRGGEELVPAIKSLGGLSEASPNFGDLREAFLKKSEHATQASARTPTGEVRYGDIFGKNPIGDDQLVQLLREKGFDFETAGELKDALDQRLKTGKQIWGMEARAEAADFTGQQGYEMGVRAGQPDLTTKIIKGVQSAVDAIQKGIGQKPLGAIEPPTLNLDNGGVRPPPPNSIFSPDTPPGSDPVPIYATRVNSAFKRWWEKFWPRDLAVQKLDKVLSAKGKEPSPVISAHQEILRTNMDYMQKFSGEPWWKALRGRPESEIIDVEDRVVKEYRKHLENGVDRDQAYKGAVGKAPKWFQDIVRNRESRIPIETKAAEELGVDPPKYTGDPYVARLTNEEGKDVVDLNPRLSNIGKQIRTTIGSFDNSREHITMKDGIAAGTQYEPVARAVWLREMNSIRLESTADLVRSLKEKGVLFDSKKAAYDASPEGKISLVRGLGGKQYWARSPEEAVFLEQNISSVPRSPLGRIQQLANTYVRNPSLVNPLPHVTKNMFFKYLMARINNATFRADVSDFARTVPSELKNRFDRVMPFSESTERMPQLTAREVGTWAEKASTRGMKLNNTSTNFIFGKADPAMRYALWKSYVRKGMADQEAANHVWIDLIRYDANSGGINFWKSIPFNFFVPWRTGSYVTLAKALTSHPIRTLAFIGAVEYLREMRYRKSGRWTHLPVDYIDAPLAEAVESGTKVHDIKSGREAAQMSAMVAATTLVFGPGGGQAPSTIKDVMAVLQNDPQQKARVMNMFWGLSQIYDLPREWNAYQQDSDPKHLVNLLTSAALAEHSALKYEPRRLMKWLPEWMPGLQKSEIVQQAEQLQARVAAKAEKGKATYEARHGVSASFERSPEGQQLEELGRAAGIGTGRSKKTKTAYAPGQ